MSEDEYKNENAMKTVFQTVHKISYRGPEFIENRVLYRLAQTHEMQVGFWRRPGILSAVTAMALGVAAISLYAVRLEQGSYPVTLGVPVVIKVEIPTMDQLSAHESATYAMIDLPAGLEFYSAKHPELKKQRSLRINLAKSQPLKEFPVLLQGIAKGRQVVRVQFYSPKGKMVSVEQVKLRVGESS